MTKKPNLTIVKPTVSSSPEPPAPLLAAGRKLWDQVHAEYDVSDVAGLALLAQSCQMLDRAEDLAAEIAADGSVLRGRDGIKDHPALKHELAARAFIVRTLDGLGLNTEPLRLGPGRPPGRGA
jgi:hypothetical protein